MQTGAGDLVVESRREMTARGIRWSRLLCIDPRLQYITTEMGAEEGARAALVYFANRKQFVHRNEMDSQCSSSGMIYDVRQHKLISVALHFPRVFFLSVVGRPYLNLSP